MTNAAESQKTGVLDRMAHTLGKMFQIDWRGEGEFIVLKLGQDEE